jgi:hypothetical protein
MIRVTHSVQKRDLVMFIEITQDWLIFVSTSVEFLDSAVTDSPIVSEDYVIKGFGAINYVFLKIHAVCRE